DAIGSVRYSSKTKEKTVCFLPLSQWLPLSRVNCLRRPEEGRRSPGTGVIGSCEMMWTLGTKLQVLYTEAEFKLSQHSGFGGDKLCLWDGLSKSLCSSGLASLMNCLGVQLQSTGTGFSELHRESVMKMTRAKDSVLTIPWSGEKPGIELASEHLTRMPVFLFVLRG
ncbi:mCG145284, partial [Mus musculus]